MTKITFSRVPPLALLGLAALAFSAAPVQALPSRVFVSGKGIDSAGCGAVTAPCRTFQKAHDNTAAGGEIIVRDSGDYGFVHITKSISIVNDGAGTASVRAASGNGVTIDGVAGAVHLRGLSITGPVSGFFNGIEATNLGSLTVVNCVVRGFGFGEGMGAHAGIFVQNNTGPTSFSISHTIVESNGDGIRVTTAGAGSAVGVIDHVLANFNARDGVTLDGANVKATVTGSVLSNNSLIGLDVESFGASATARNVTASHNLSRGFGSFTSATLRIAHSVATGNNFGVTGGPPAGSVVESFGDNNLRGNAIQDVNGGLTPVADQ